MDAHDTVRPSLSASETAVRSIDVMAVGDLADFEAVVAPGAVNREDAVEPPACRVGGPEGFHATALWLRAAYSDLRHEMDHVVAERDLVVVHATMSGCHTGDFVLHGPDGTVDRVWAPTGRTFAVAQTHWFRLADGLVTEHWAVRDDLGQSLQLGWVPPTPRYLVRCALATRRARRALR
ncbi:ester cyclase [Nocardioides currus]|uniref:Ester cyclase n=1 Tax=Nocardioides currus TaxID=2133958 RepID=A0A2R7YYP7_9ACTN|nr:ester cyclase [Nocardioides currus]PUA81508.1 hypothetical protein C7S10_05350 [Nocardioides currus]